MPSDDALINQLADDGLAVTFTSANAYVEAYQDIQAQLMATDRLKTARACQPPAYMGRPLKGVRNIPRLCHIARPHARHSS